MADEDLDLDLEEEKKGGKMKLIIIAVVVLLLGGGAAVYFLGLGPFAKEEPAAEETKAEEEKPAEPEVTIYEGMDEPMVINLVSGKHPRYLQLGVKFLVRKESAAQALQLHMPVVQNNLQELVSVKSYADLQKPGAKKALRKQILENINAMLEEKTGEPDLVEAVFFETFVVQ